MNITAELQRIWFLDRQALQYVPMEKVFTGRVPNAFINEDNQEEEINPPFISITTPDNDTPGGTSHSIDQTVLVQVSVFHQSRAQAEIIRDYARDLFEDVELMLDATKQTFQDISISSGGELPAENGIYHFFQRFEVELSIPRPQRRKRR